MGGVCLGAEPQHSPWQAGSARVWGPWCGPGGGAVLLWVVLTSGPAPQVVYYVFAIIGINLFRGVIVVPPGNGR